MVAGLRTTRFSDVCGSLDEIKRMLREEESPDPTVLAELLEDVCYMLGRMDRRLREYHEFERRATPLLERIRAVGPSHQEEALDLADRMQAHLGNPGADVGGIEGVCTQAEAIRDVANALEEKLRRSKEAAAALYRACLELRGGRASQDADADGTDAALAARMEAWLPPSPHRERILDFLARGRAHLLDPPVAGDAPLVEFEDGGVMALQKVRWSDDVENFHPAGQQPHPGGLRHRG